MKTILIILLTLFISSCEVSNDIITPEPINDIQQWSESDKELFNIIQDYRISLNLSTLVPNKDIRNIAIERINNISITEDISHNNVGDIFIAIRDLGYEESTELLALGYSNNQKAFEALLRSNSHHKAILNNNTYIGVHSLNYNNKNYYIVLFAK